MKAEYAFKKFQKYLDSIQRSGQHPKVKKFLTSEKKEQFLFCKDEFSLDPISKKIYVRVFGEIDIEDDGDSVKTKEVDFITIQEDNNDDYSITFYTFKGNPYGKDSPLLQDDGFIRAVPIGVRLIES